jgi:putative oxidoreductase
MKPRLRNILATRAPASTLLVRLIVGWVFFSEGAQKFLYDAQLGAGRFEKIGIPWPHVMGPLVGAVEIGAGAMVILGLLTRPAALLLLINISVAILSTKVPILLGRGFWWFAAPKIAGFWSMAHEARVDICMWLGCLFLIIVGAGRASLDALFVRAMAQGGRL